MTLAQVDQILGREDDSSPSQVVVDQKTPGQVGLLKKVLDPSKAKEHHALLLKSKFSSYQKL